MGGKRLCVCNSQILLHVLGERGGMDLVESVEATNYNLPTLPLA